MSGAPTSPTFPVTDDVLDALDHALGSRLTYDDEGGNPLPPHEGPRRVGADFGMPQLLDFYSGYDPERLVLIQGSEALADAGLNETLIYEHLDPIYSRDDVIRALIAEVRRLRTTHEGDNDA